MQTLLENHNQWLWFYLDELFSILSAIDLAISKVSLELADAITFLTSSTVEETAVVGVGEFILLQVHMILLILR